MYTSSATPLSQVYKIPVFITHFVEHDNGGDFLDEMEKFLVHHYGGHDVDDDWETDQKLPFMKVEMAHLVQISIPIFKLTIPNFNVISYKEPMVLFDDDALYSYYLNTIWQPPKHA